MDVNNRIRQLMASRGWSEYRLAKESGLPQSTITNIFRRNTVPSIITLEAICKGFKINLSQFFFDEKEKKNIQVTNEEMHLYHLWQNLTSEQKELIIGIMANMK